MRRNHADQCQMLLVFMLLAHSWYPTFCCSETDCRPVPCAEIKISGKWLTYRGLHIQLEAAKPSPDGQCHVCADQVRFRCVFIPVVTM